jgi:hypothetical protein
MNDCEATEKLVTLEEHQVFLQHILTTARERVLIVSPYISISAIKSDNLTTLIKQARTRAVEVQIYVDSKSNSYADGTMTARAIDGISELIHAGAKVAVVNGLRSIFIVRDNDILTKGEFNWLSALRIRNGECSLKEPTQVFMDDDAATKIIPELKQIEVVEYEFATIQESDDGFEITKTGKLVGLFSLLILPALIGNDLGNINAGLVCTAVMLITGALYYAAKVANSIKPSNPRPI